jgi:hypothetical protein
MPTDQPAFFDVSIGDPPQPARIPGAVLTIRPGETRAEITSRIAAQDPAFVDVFMGAASKTGVLVIFDDDWRVERVQYHRAFPATVSIERLRFGMTVDEMTVARPDLYRAGDDSYFAYWRSTATMPYLTEVGILRGRIGKIELYSPAWVECERRKLAETAARLAAFRDEQERLYLPQTLADVDKILDEWASSNTYWGIKDDRFRWLAAWLRSASPDGWHAMADGWNWDNGIEPLAWIARQPDCDKATALTIYWRTEPHYYAQYDWLPPGGQKATWDELVAATAVQIAARWSDGFYHRSEIGWHADAYLARLDMAKLRAAESMRQSLPGRAISTTDFDDQVPSPYNFD